MTTLQTPSDHPPPPVLQGREQLLAGLPYLLGYRPERSVVLVGSWVDELQPAVGGRNRLPLAVTVRIDLPDRPDRAGAVMAEVADPLDRAIRERRTARGAVARPGPAMLTHLFILDADDELAASVLRAARVLLGEVGAPVHEALLVRGGIYLPLVSAGETDPPVGGGWDAEQGEVGTWTGPLRHRPTDWLATPSPHEVQAVADWVLQGRSPHGTREDVVERVRQRDEHAAGETARALARARRPAAAPGVEDGLAWLGSAARGAQLRASQRAGVVLALEDREVRDLVLARWIPELFDGHAATDWPLAELLGHVEPLPPGRSGPIQHLLNLSAQLPEEQSVPLLTLVGALAWWEGEGTVANEVIDLCLERDPGYRLALLLDTALRHGLSPRALAARAAA